MATLVVHERSAWEDRFRTPSESVLMGAIPKGVVPAFERMRAGLAELPGVEEHLAWCGVPWRWSWEYRAADGSVGGEDGHGLAYVVPNPARPALVVPVPDSTLGLLSGRDVSKPVREQVAVTPSVGGWRWAAWDLTSRGLADELLGLVSIVMNHTPARAGG
ncbi:MAG: hypothetical protein HRU70_09360 [Phycisphaeraceae bacterium]|nr:MAG: hypothetical protein HRU70_09360 [Phycisphaeraceae bacterium]